MRKGIVIIFLITLLFIGYSCIKQASSKKLTLLETLAKKNWTIKDYFVKKVRVLDPEMMGGVSFELYGASGKHYYCHFPKDFKSEGRTRPIKKCTIEQAIDMIEGAMITRRDGWPREITNYEDFKAIDDFLRTCKPHQIQQYFYAVVEFSVRFIDYSEMTIEERNVIFLENETKIDNGRLLFFMYYDIEKDLKWIRKNILSQK